VIAAAGVEQLRACFGAALDDALPKHLTRLGWDSAQLVRHQRQRLQIILEQARERSPFHAARLRGIDLSAVDVNDLSALPVMTKADMMYAYDQVPTDRRLTRAAIEDHLARSSQTPSALFGNFVCLASGGSSGERGIFVQTIAEFAEFVSSIMRRAIVANQSPPARREPFTIAMIAAASPVHSTGMACALAGGAMRLISVPATAPIDDTVERLNDLRPGGLMGYPTRIARLATEQLRGRLCIAPATVTTVSETLTPEDRHTITRGFGVAVIDQFASTEGLVGHSPAGSSVLTFASDNCIAELVDAGNEPVAPGTEATKVLVTNLHNLTQPLIRYELDDRLIGHPDDRGLLRASVDGRTDDTFHYGPVTVHPLVVRSVMVATPAVCEYQVHQTANGVEIVVVAEPGLNRTALARSLEDALRVAGLPEPVATVRTVATISRHPATGKARRFIPLPQ
jgi:phenylacetate-coenzyme A ligase PaaK-like adenylate-forming protein